MIRNEGYLRKYMHGRINYDTNMAKTKSKLYYGIALKGILFKLLSVVRMEVILFYFPYFHFYVFSCFLQLNSTLMIKI